MPNLPTKEGIRWFLTGILFHTLGMHYTGVQTIEDGLEVKGLRCPPLPKKGENTEWATLTPKQRKETLVQTALRNANEFLETHITWEPQEDRDVFRYNK